VKGKVVVVGSANVDLVMKMARLPKVGETVTEATFVQAFGGKGANQAVGAARAGGGVVFVACVGDDAYGAQLRSALEADGIDTRFVFSEVGVASGTALIMVGGEGQNYISVAPGANYRLTPAHVERAGAAIEQAAIVIGQCEIRPEALDRAIALGSELGKPVMLNLAPARRIDGASLAPRPRAGDRDPHPGRARRLGVREGHPRARSRLRRGRGGHDRGGRRPLRRARGRPGGGRPLLEAVRFANAAAALSTTRLGAQPSAPRRGEIDALLARG
jgi:ribokinase